MLDSMFVETMSRAISDYRLILKKYLSPEQRVSKIAELRLKDPTIYDDESTLFQVVQNILSDIEKNIRVPNEGYYSYYGIVRFAKFLREYIDNYTLEGNVVIHKAQKASNLLLKIIQLLSTEDFTDNISQQVITLHPLLFELSTKDQVLIYKNTLKKFEDRNKKAYRKVIEDFKIRSGEITAVAA
ncbi:MAG: hypothetical protein JSR33_00260 [Proteobacteria bacterium]|nr:hypothetical protein [Pseudomonadota bacterium]